MNRPLLLLCATVAACSAAHAQPSATPEPEVYGVQLAPRAPANALTDGGAAGYIAGYLNGNTITKTMLFQSAGKIGIGTTNPPHTLSVAGNIATNKALIFLGTSGTGIVFGDGSTQRKGVEAPFLLSGNSVAATITAKNAGTGPGLYGEAADDGGALGGVVGVSTKSGGNGVVGRADNGSSAYGVYGTSSTGKGVYGSGVTGVQGSGSAYGVYGSGGSTAAVYGTGSWRGVWGVSSASFGVEGDSTSSVGVAGYSSTSNGVQGVSGSGPGLFAQSTSSSGVDGRSNTGNGVQGISQSGTGVLGQSASGYGGFFYGNVGITGTLTKGGGSFKIDHPLDPAHKFLSHSFVESPDMMNIYNGNVRLDKAGRAVIRLPAYFSALNQDFRYQLTCIGAPALVYIAQKIKNNQFVIAGGKPGLEVSWQVTGIRRDAYARDHRIRVEEPKAQAEWGKYLYPAGFGAGPDKSLGAKAQFVAAEPKK